MTRILRVALLGGGLWSGRGGGLAGDLPGSKEDQRPAQQRPPRQPHPCILSAEAMALRAIAAFEAVDRR